MQNEITLLGFSIHTNTRKYLPQLGSWLHCLEGLFEVLLGIKETGKMFSNSTNYMDMYRCTPYHDQTKERSQKKGWKRAKNRKRRMGKEKGRKDWKGRILIDG